MTAADEKRVREIATAIAVDVVRTAAPVIIAAARERPSPREWR